MTKRGRSADFALDENQVHRLWSMCVDEEEQVLIGQLLYEGMRVSEAIHTRRDWVRGGNIAIPSEQPCDCSACAPHGVWRPKSAAGARVIPIAKPLTKPLHHFFEQHPEGLGITRQAAWKRVKHIATRAEIGYVTPHALRATAATIFALAGWNAAELCLMMGWSDINRAWHYINIALAQKGLIDKMDHLHR